MVEYLVLDLPSSFNAIISWPSQVEFSLRCGIRSLTLTFETPRGDALIYTSQLPVRNNYVETMSITSGTHRPKKEGELMEDTKEPCLKDLTDDVEVVLGNKFKIGKDLINPHKEKLIHSLKHTSMFSPGICMTCLGLTLLLLHIRWM